VADGPTAGPSRHDPDDHGNPDRHDERHELLVAALLDRDLSDHDRAGGAELVGTCSTCAALVADMAALSVAIRALPTAARSRDFKLTAGDAVRLGPIAAPDGEPRGAVSRLTGDMHVPNADHARHDQQIVASLLDRSTGGAERDRAEALVSSCRDCADLHRDLLSLREATRSLPTAPRPRDFTLSSEAAARLRRTGWRGLIAAFGSTRDAFSRPLAIGLTTLGLAGLLVTTIPGALSLGSGSTAGVPTIGQAVGGAGLNSEAVEAPKPAFAPSAAPSAAPPPGAAAIAPSAGPTAGRLPAAASSPEPSSETFDTFAGTVRQGSAAGTDSASISAQALSPADRLEVIVPASLLLVAGLGLFALRWAGRRV
jgi:hypothetical protein